MDNETDKELEEIRNQKLEKMKIKAKLETEGELVIDVKDADFSKDVLERSKYVPVVVDFWADWCMPCKMLGPVLEKVAKEYNREFILAKINVDEEKETAIKYAISSIPAVKLFKDGKIVDEFVGSIPEAQVKSWIDKNLK